jgi:hypothetical protein
MRTRILQSQCRLPPATRNARRKSSNDRARRDRGIAALQRAATNAPGLRWATRCRAASLNGLWRRAFQPVISPMKLGHVRAAGAQEPLQVEVLKRHGFSNGEKKGDRGRTGWADSKRCRQGTLWLRRSQTEEQASLRRVRSSYLASWRRPGCISLCTRLEARCRGHSTWEAYGTQLAIEAGRSSASSFGPHAAAVAAAAGVGSRVARCRTQPRRCPCRRGRNRGDTGLSGTVSHSVARGRQGPRSVSGLLHHRGAESARAWHSVRVRRELTLRDHDGTQLSRPPRTRVVSCCLSLRLRS